MMGPAVVRSVRRRGRAVALAAACLAVAAPSLAVAPLAAQAQAVGVDLVTSVDPAGGTVAAGAPTSVRVGIQNLGSVRATDVVLLLALPPSARYVGTADDGCAATAAGVTCPLGDLGPGDGVYFTIDLRFDEVGTFPVATSATADQPDADGDSRSELPVAVVEEEADLDVSGGSERAPAGQVHQVRHFVWNRGPTDAGPVAIRGTFPAGADLVPGSFVLQYGGGDGAGDLCDLTATGFTCAPVPGIRATSAAELRYDVVVPDEVGPIESTVTATGRNDPDPTNDTGTLVLEVGTPLAELRLDLLAYGPVSGGQPFPVTLWTWNAGDGPAEDVVATIEVPDGWLVGLPTTPDPGRTCEAIAADEVRCTDDAIEPGGRWDLQVPVTPPSTGHGTGTITATVETPTPETGTFPDTASADVAFAPVGVDLVAVSATDDPATPHSGPPGGTITWRFRNATPDRLVTDRTFTVALPPGVRATFLEAMEAGGGVACDVDPLDRTPSCRLTGTGSMGDTDVTLHVAYDTGGTFAFTATASQTSPEQAPGDESLTHVVEVEPATADLLLTAERSAEEVTVGETYSYLVRVANDGPHDATGVVLRDELPAGTELVSVRRGWIGWRCPVDGRTWACALGTLAPGASTFAEVTVRATTAGTASSTPTVRAAQGDPDPASNAAPVAVDVVEPGDESAVDLVLTRLTGPDPVEAGLWHPEVFLVENRSARAATGVTFHLEGGDAADLVVGAGSFGWFGRACTPTATSTCTLPTIGAHRVQFVTVAVVAPRPGTIDATASVSADQPDADPSTDTVAVTGTVVPPG